MSNGHHQELRDDGYSRSSSVHARVLDQVLGSSEGPVQRHDLATVGDQLHLAEAGEVLKDPAAVRVYSEQLGQLGPFQAALRLDDCLHHRPTGAVALLDRTQGSQLSGLEAFGLKHAVGRGIHADRVEQALVAELRAILKVAATVRMNSHPPGRGDTATLYAALLEHDDGRQDTALRVDEVSGLDGHVPELHRAARRVVQEETGGVVKREVVRVRAGIWRCCFPHRSKQVVSDSFEFPSEVRELKEHRLQTLDGLLVEHRHLDAFLLYGPLRRGELPL